MRTRHRFATLASLALAAIVATSVAVPASALSAAPAATDPAAIAWSVATVDGPNGDARPNFAYVEDPGATQRDSLRVANTGTTALDLAVYAADAYTTPTGNIDLDTVDIAPDDAGSWITLSTDRIQLAPGEETVIDFRVSVPDDATPGDHSAGIVTSLRSDGSETLTVDRRLATRVSVRVAGDLVPAVTVGGVQATYVGSWNPFDGGTLRLDYDVTNSGNTRLAGTDALTTAGPFGAFERTATGADLPEILPGSTVTVQHEVDVTPWGLLTGTVTVTPEAVGLGAQAVTPVTVPYDVVAVPWMLIALLVVIAGIVVTVILVIRSRRRRAAGAVTDAAAATA